VTEVDFHKLAAQGYTRALPVLAEARADLYTPLAVYVKLANGPYLLSAGIGGRRRRGSGATRSSALPAPSRIEAPRPHAAAIAARCARRRRLPGKGWRMPIPSNTRAAAEASPRGSDAGRVCASAVAWWAYFRLRNGSHIEPHALSSEKPDLLGTPDMLLPRLR